MCPKFLREISLSWKQCSRIFLIQALLKHKHLPNHLLINQNSICNNINWAQQEPRSATSTSIPLGNSWFLYIVSTQFSFYKRYFLSFASSWCMELPHHSFWAFKGCSNSGCTITPVIIPNYSSLHQKEHNTFIKSIFWENLDTLEELQVGAHNYGKQ